MASMTHTAVSAKQMETLPALLPPFIQHSVKTPAMAAARLETAELHSSRPGRKGKERVMQSMPRVQGVSLINGNPV